MFLHNLLVLFSSIPHREYDNLAYVATDRFYGLRVDGLGEHAAVLRDVLDHLIEGGSLHLLPLEVTERVNDKVEEHHALAQLLNEQLLPLGRSRI